MAFSGWPADALEFYEGLEADNSKTYWSAHKAVYDRHVLAPMRELVEELAAEFGEPRIFRPYRDLRFSADKTPYKTNIGGMLGQTNYVSLSADGLAAGNGLYQMDQGQLVRYRTAVDSTGDGLTEIIGKLKTDGIEVRGTGTLKTAPRGYPADHPRIDLLRHKGLYAWRHWPAEQWLETAQVKDEILAFYRTTHGFSSWLIEHVTGLTSHMSQSDDALRVSDAERDEVLNALGDHAAAGRLTLDELDERSSKALAAKTRGELTLLTSDLPGGELASGELPTAPTAASRAPVRWMVAIMGGSHRRGRFRAVGQVNSVNVMGGDEIDLRDAEIEGGKLTINVFSLMGGSNIYVPESIEVDLGGFSFMGGNQEHGRMAKPRRGAPMIRVRAFNFMGGIQIYHLPPEARGASLSKARKLAKQAERGELPQA